jgi:hypothetical protein
VGRHILSITRSKQARPVDVGNCKLQDLRLLLRFEAICAHATGVRVQRSLGMDMSGESRDSSQVAEGDEF